MGHADEQQAQAKAATAAGLPSCPACCARAVRAAARYCATCGRSLRERDYRPADRLRASYRWPAVTTTPARRAPPAARTPASRRCRNERTARGYVFLAYSLVPFVGVVFCACAVACCAAGLCEAMRARQRAAEFEARRGLSYAVLLAGAQALIWLVAFRLPLRMLS